MKTVKAATLALSLSLALAGCDKAQPTAEGEQNDRESLYQISTIQALTASDYHGIITIADLLKHGDIGIGTFEGVNGEMIVLDGICYQALADGKIAKPAETEKTPFAAITWFDNDFQQELANEMDFEALKDTLNSIVEAKGANTFYAARIEGTFPEMQVRSISKQKEPYPTLDAAMKADQVVFDYTDTKGTLIAFYCPQYAAGVNAAGWHMHFLSEKKDKGGHVLGFKMSRGVLTLDRTDNFQMTLPNTDYFNKLNLTDQQEAVGKVEQGK